jgi:hypothetical protein
VRGILDATDAVERVAGVERVALAGICSGGILAGITAAYLAGTGKSERLAAFGLAVTVLDNARAGAPAALGSRRTAAAAKALSKRRGYLDGRALAEVFAWLRPGDLVSNYWVNNYLLGKKPPAFDILFWNSDTTRMSAGLHADFVDLAVDNVLTEPGTLTVLGVPIDLGRVDVDRLTIDPVRRRSLQGSRVTGATRGRRRPRTPRVQHVRLTRRPGGCARPRRATQAGRLAGRPKSVRSADRNATIWATRPLSIVRTSRPPGM